MRQSPARSLSAYADVGDCEYVNGSPARLAMRDVVKRQERGEVIAPPHSDFSGNAYLGGFDSRGQRAPSRFFREQSPEERVEERIASGFFKRENRQ